jgi:hypothetical protein
MMDELTYRALDQMLGSGGLTNHPSDNKRAVMALRSVWHPIWGYDTDDARTVMDMILRKRANFRRWVIETQREWQTHQRSVTPRTLINRYNQWGQRHDLGTLIRDSEERIATREGYVRCDGKQHSARPMESTWQ